ncbi:hypothetical protein Droror1_Dr00015094 [Drosera rotundifolia]
MNPMKPNNLPFNALLGRPNKGHSAHYLSENPAPFPSPWFAAAKGPTRRKTQPAHHQSQNHLSPSKASFMVPSCSATHIAEKHPGKFPDFPSSHLRDPINYSPFTVSIMKFVGESCCLTSL